MTIKSPSASNSSNKRSYRHKIRTCSQANDGLEISWHDGGSAIFFPYAWLRDWCPCEKCTDRHEIESAVLLDIDLMDRPASALINDEGELELTWKSDGHSSIFSPDWLKDHSGDSTPKATRPSGDDLTSNIPTITYGSFQNNEVSQLRLFEYVRDFGYALVQGVPSQPDEVGEIGLCLGYVKGGWRYSAQPEEILVAPARPSKSAGANSQAEAMLEAQDEHFRRTLLVPHTDFSFTSWPTGLFVFHCLRPSPDGGGETILVDGFHVAERLRSENPEAFGLLSTIRYPFRGHGSVKRDWCSRARVISIDERGTVTGIRFALGSRMPLPSSHASAGPYTKALQSMLRLVLDPSCQIHLPLSAGDCIVMDNHRILHGRTGMDPKAGDTRWFRRFDVERDAAQSRMQVLARNLSRPVAPLPTGAHG